MDDIVRIEGRGREGWKEGRKEERKQCFVDQWILKIDGGGGREFGSGTHYC